MLLIFNSILFARQYMHIIDTDRYIIHIVIREDHFDCYIVQIPCTTQMKVSTS